MKSIKDSIKRNWWKIEANLLTLWIVSTFVLGRFVGASTAAAWFFSGCIMYALAATNERFFYDRMNK